LIRQAGSIASPDQLRYAHVLGIGAGIGFALLALTFLAYLLGLRPPLVAPDRLAMYWTLPLAQYVKATHTPTGWAWLALIGKGDVLNLVGIAVLAATPAAACLALLPGFARRRQFALFTIALLQFFVLLAASVSLFPSAR
jgi:hypothetical protein